MGLKSFIELGAGFEPLVFIGRGAAIPDIETVTRHIWQSFERQEKGPRNNVRVRSGAPASGKSAMLAYLDSKWEREGSPEPLMLNLVPSEMDDMVYVARKLGNLLAAGRGTLVPTLHTSLQNWQVNPGIGQVGGQSETHTPPPKDPIEAVLEYFPGEK